MTRLGPHSLRARLLWQILPPVAVAIVAITAIARGIPERGRDDRELIGEIQAETARAVDVVEEGARRTDDGVATVEQANSAFAAIRDGIGEVDAQVAEIAAVIQRIESAAGQMLTELGDVASVAESSSASTEQVSASAQETSANTQEIAASAGQLAGQAERLEQLVGQFALRD
jgi:methyl-accepting chemotaxis protein